MQVSETLLYTQHTQFRLATLQVLSSHMWLEAATLDSADVSHTFY